MFLPFFFKTFLDKTSLSSYYDSIPYFCLQLPHPLFYTHIQNIENLKDKSIFAFFMLFCAYHIVYIFIFLQMIFYEIEIVSFCYNGVRDCLCSFAGEVCFCNHLWSTSCSIPKSMENDWTRFSFHRFITFINDTCLNWQYFSLFTRS